MTQNGDLPNSFSDFLLEVVAGQAAAQIENGIWVGDSSGIFGAGFVSDDGVFDQLGLNASATADFTQVTMNGGVTANAANDDAAFQIKGSSDDNLLQVNPQSLDKVGIGTETPNDPNDDCDVPVQQSTNASDFSISHKNPKIFENAILQYEANHGDFMDLIVSNGIMTEKEFEKFIQQADFKSFEGAYDNAPD